MHKAAGAAATVAAPRVRMAQTTTRNPWRWLPSRFPTLHPLGEDRLPHRRCANGRNGARGAAHCTVASAWQASGTQHTDDDTTHASAAACVPRRHKMGGRQHRLSVRSAALHVRAAASGRRNGPAVSRKETLPTLKQTSGTENSIQAAWTGQRYTGQRGHHKRRGTAGQRVPPRRRTGQTTSRTLRPLWSAERSESHAHTRRVNGRRHSSDTHNTYAAQRNKWGGGEACTSTPAGARHTRLHTATPPPPHAYSAFTAMAGRPGGAAAHTAHTGTKKGAPSCGTLVR